MATTKVRLYQLVRLMVDGLALHYKAKVSSWISRAKFLSNGHFSTFTFFQPFKVHTLLVKEFHDMMRAVVNNYCVTMQKKSIRDHSSIIASKLTRENAIYARKYHFSVAGCLCKFEWKEVTLTFTKRKEINGHTCISWELNKKGKTNKHNFRNHDNAFYLTRGSISWTKVYSHWKRLASLVRCCQYKK